MRCEIWAQSTQYEGEGRGNETTNDTKHVCDKHACTFTCRLIFSITDLADVVLHQSGGHIDLVAAPGVFSR